MPTVARKVLASLAVIGAAAALPLFATVGSFLEGADPFPHSVQGAPTQH